LVSGVCFCFASDQLTPPDLFLLCRKAKKQKSFDRLACVDIERGKRKKKMDVMPMPQPPGRPRRHPDITPERSLFRKNGKKIRNSVDFSGKRV